MSRIFAPRAGLALGAAVLATILAGCATAVPPVGSPEPAPSSASPDSSASPTGPAAALPDGAARRWILVGFETREDPRDLSGSVATLDLDRSGEVSGSDGCVGFGGSITSFAAPDDPTAGAPAGPTVGIRISDLIHTMQACVPDTAIRGYLDTLDSSTGLTVVGDTLYLAADGASLKFAPNRMKTIDPPRPD